MIQLSEFLKSQEIEVDNVKQTNSNIEEEYRREELEFEFIRKNVELKIQLQNAENENKEHNLKRWFAIAIFIFVCVYMLGVLVCVILNASPCKFYLSDKTIGYLLGSTAVSIVGLLASVMKYLLYKKK